MILLNWMKKYYFCEKMLSPDYFDSLRQEPTLIAKCLVTDEAHASMSSAIALSGTSKTYNYITKTQPFFKWVVGLIDRTHFFIETQEFEEKEEMSFKHRYFKLRDLYLKKEETFPGILFGTAFANNQSVEIISFHDGIKNFMLKENSLCQSIHIPDDRRIPPRRVFKASPCVARSENFLAINQRCDSAIYIYEANGEKYLARYVLEGEICQLHIQNNFLFVVEKHLNGSNSLLVFNLALCESQTPLVISLRDGFKKFYLIKNYLIYSQELSGHQMHALSLSCLKNTIQWITDNTTQWITDKYILPREDHFIEVIFTDSYVCDIFEVTITLEGFKKVKIAEKIVICEKIQKSFCCDVFFHKERIFFAYEGWNKTDIFSYDMISHKISKTCSISQGGSNSPFKPRFLSTANTLHYLIMGFGDFTPGAHTTGIQSNLLTLTYGKV